MMFRYLRHLTNLLMIDMLNLLWVFKFSLVLALYNGHLLVTSIRVEEWFIKMGTRKKIVFCIVCILLQQSAIKTASLWTAQAITQERFSVHIEIRPYRDLLDQGWPFLVVVEYNYYY